MRVIVKMIQNAIIVLLLSAVSFGATIISPEEDQQVDAGSWITVIVKPDQGEQWENFIAGFKPFEYDSLRKEYMLKIQVPKDALGFRDDLRVYGLDKSGNEVWLKRRIFVKLPPTVVLKGIAAGSKVVSGSTLVLLRKMPDGSSLADIENYEKAELSVYGKYSDGVERSITSSTAGTTYTSSNENIATVSPEGKVTTEGLGTTTITVRNGNYSATVKVVVKPYKP